MISNFSYVREALALFSPENGLDYTTAASLLRHQLQTAGWQEGLTTEFTQLLADDSIDWRNFVSNEEYCLGDFDGPADAKAYVVRLLGPFLLSVR